jgi:hypothetical protein
MTSQPIKLQDKKQRLVFQTRDGQGVSLNGEGEVQDKFQHVGSIPNMSEIYRKKDILL